ncbi:hypothetical protein [Kushneria phosphatilytica]|uniref:Uncharacterized protein n=1 Tax=Kushneria phosphatilytica TaxID=657387 RepID=A0A1S1NTC1_9GAMM|nr:hypothetical protein [Kushneria phosphatilytica]OHV12829.1 hypothetical protein BH688_01980 [Kushneria phosphatilytica]QEL10679.1 hypothetical protein FY550_05750 [Kushneria phosphatilytica]
MDLFWIALLAIMLGWYGLIRGFTRDICITVMLMAAGVMMAQLIWFDRHWAYGLAILLAIGTIIGCLREGQKTLSNADTRPIKRHQPLPRVSRKPTGNAMAKRRSGRGC